MSDRYENCSIHGPYSETRCPVCAGNEFAAERRAKHLALAYLREAMAEVDRLNVELTAACKVCAAAMEWAGFVPNVDDVDDKLHDAICDYRNKHIAAPSGGEAR